MKASRPTALLTLFVLAASALLQGCGKPSEQTTSTGAAKGRLFGVSFQTMNNPFFVELNKGLLEVIEKHGDTLITLDAQFNSLKQKNDVSDLILKGAAGVFINPVNWEGVRGSLLQAKGRKVPCIIVDAPVKDEDLVFCQVASDNVEAGRLAARALAQARHPAKIVILHHSVNKACIDRVAGFREELAKYPDMQVVDTQEGKGTTEGGRPVMLDLMGRFPDINGAFPINDPSALGAISALESLGKLKDVTVAAVDGSREAIDAIKAGKLHSTSAQFPREIGRIAAEKIYDHLAGKPVEKDIKVPVKLITKENADEFLKGQ
ncbi:MAG: sugar ABC transporter substrate-binding protein [Verrucomicrobia bacterium]|nr:sugar ABC transporter substrate-binding protein [Verrucomicrobiota bacterium]